MPGRKRKSPQSSEGEPPRKLVKDSPRLQTLPATNSSTPLSLRRAGTLMVEPGRSSSASPPHKSKACARTDSSMLKFVEPVTQANRCEKPACIPSGLTKLALTSSGSNLSLQVSTSDLLPNVDEAEMTSALASLKDTDNVEWGPSKPAVEQVSMHKLPAIPSGLTKLAFASSDSNRSLNIPGSDLIGTIDDFEMGSALQSLKSTRSNTKYKTRLHDNLKKDDDTADQSEIKKTISRTTESGAVALQFLTSKEPTCKLITRYLDDPKNVDATEQSELKTAITSNTPELLNPVLQSLTSENPKQSKLECGSRKKEKDQKKTKTKDQLEPGTSVINTPVAAVTNTRRPFEVVVIMHGELEEVRTYVKDFTKTLKEYIPDVRLAVVSSGEYKRNTTDGLIRYQDFTDSLEKVFTFVDAVERTFGRQVRTTYNRMMKAVNEQLSWTCRGGGEIVHIGDYDDKKRFDMAENALRIAQFHGYVSSEAVSDSKTTASPQSEVKKPQPQVITPSVRMRKEQSKVPVAKNKKRQIGKAGVSAGVRCSGGSVEQSMIPNSSHAKEKTMERRKTRISERIQSKERFKRAENKMKTTNAKNNSERAKLSDKEVSATAENPKQSKLECGSRKKEKDQKKTKIKDQLEPGTYVTSTPVAAATNTSGPFEVVVIMHGGLKEVRTYVKDFTKTLKEYIPDVRLAVVSSGEYKRDTTDGLIRYQDFTDSLEKVFTFVDTVERTFGRQVRTTYNRMMKAVKQQLSWTCRGRGEIVHIGDYDGKKRIDMAEQALRIAQFHGYVSSEAVSDSKTTASPQSEVKKPQPRVKTPSVRTKKEQGTVPAAKNKKKQTGKVGLSAGIRCCGGSVEQSMIPNSSHAKEKTMDRRKTRISERIQSKERFKRAGNKMKTTNGKNNSERAKLSDKEVSATAETPKQSKLKCGYRKNEKGQKKTKTKDQVEPGTSVTSTPVAAVTNTSGPFEVVVLMHGGLEEVRTYVKDFTKTLKEYIPDVRLAVASIGEYIKNKNAGLIRYQDFTDSLQEIFTFVDTVERIFGGDGGTTYNPMMKAIHEQLSWTCRGRGLVVHIGDYDVKNRFNMAEQALRIAQCHGYVSIEAVSDINTTDSPESEVKIPQPRVKTPAVGKKMEQGIVPVPMTRKRPIRKSFVSDEIRYSSRLSGGSVEQSIVSKSSQAKENIKNRRITRISKRIQSKERSKLQRNKIKTTIGINNKERTKIGDKETISAAKYKFRTKSIKMPAKNIEKPTRKHHASMKIDQSKVKTKQKLLREELADNDVLANSSNKLLEWSDWVLAISETPPGHLRASFKRPRNSQWYQRKDLGDEINVETLFEFGVKLAMRKKIYAVYFWNGYHCEANKGKLTDYLLRYRKVRLEVKRLMKNKCQIYVRRASGTGKDKATQQINMKQAVDYIKTIDYAWLRHGKEGHRKVIKNGTLISDNTL